MTTNDVSDTRISDERLEALAKGYETWGKTNSAQPGIDLDTASALRELIARRHPQPVNEPAEMTPEEIRLEDLKQMAEYNGPVVSFDVREPYYLASCDKCGWVGSTELCGTESFGDDSDVYCPRCHASGADCGKVAEALGRAASIPAPERSKEETVRMLAAIDELRREEGSGVEILCDNPDFNGQPNNAVICIADWTRYEPHRVSGHTLLQALENAVAHKKMATEAGISALETPPLHKEGEAATSGSAAEYDRDQLAKLAFSIYYSANLCAPQNIAAVIEEIDTCGNSCEHVSGSTCYREQAGKFCPFSVAEDLRQLSAALYGPKPPRGYIESVFGPDRMSALRAAPVPVPVTITNRMVNIAWAEFNAKTHATHLDAMRAALAAALSLKPGEQG